MKLERAVAGLGEDSIQRQGVEVDVEVEPAAEALDQPGIAVRMAQPNGAPTAARPHLQEYARRHAGCTATERGS